MTSDKKNKSKLLKANSNENSETHSSQSSKKRRHLHVEQSDTMTIKEPTIQVEPESLKADTFNDPTPTQQQVTPDRSSRKRAKAALKAELLLQVPSYYTTSDGDEIPYSKIQIRRMMRRVKNGLSPIPTEEEEREIRARVASEKQEEENFYLNMKVENEHEDGSEKEEEESAEMGSENECQESMLEQKQHQPTLLKKRSKNVPSDYICQACKNNMSNFEPHWIHDCPYKISNVGSNKVDKKLRGLNDPSSAKVFVSGLPFNVTEVQVKRFFIESICSESKKVKVSHCKLLKFEDSQRCKGQGIVTFDSEESAKSALKLDGCFWTSDDEKEERAKKNCKKSSVTNKDVDGKEKKKLKLRVTKVLNRFLTKQNKR